MNIIQKSVSSLFLFFIALSSVAQITPAPNRDQGDGPYTQLIIRGVTLINGTGAPAIGPVDIVIENNRIVKIPPATKSNQNRYRRTQNSFT
jgi:hypothetical protein